MGTGDTNKLLGKGKFDTLLSRRSMLRTAGFAGGGVAAAALLGCGGDDDSEVAPAATSPEAPESGRDYADEWGSAYPFQFPEPDKAPKRGGVFRWSTNWDISVFDPTVSSAAGTIGPVNVVYNRLLGYKRGVHFDPFKTEMEPEIATSWEISPDGLTYTFRLAPNIRWHNLQPLNGRPFLAQDLKAAFDKYAAGGVGASYFLSVDGMETPDDRTLLVRMRQPEADFLAPLGSRYLPIFPPELVNDGTLSNRMVGTGPMLVKEANPSRSVVYERNPDYFEREVLLDGMEAVIQTDLAARLAGFRSGQTDYAYSIVSGVSDVNSLLGTNPDTQINADSPIKYGSTLALQLRDPKWQDARVRRALTLAIDRAKEIAIIYEGEGWYLPAAPWIWTFDSRPSDEALGRWWRYAPDEAVQLLDAAGVRDLVIDYQYYQYSSRNTQTAELYADMLREVGIVFRPRSLDYTEYNSQWVGGTFQDTSFGWMPFGFAPNTPYYEHVNSSSRSNRWGIKDAQIDEWAEKQRGELDPDVRRELHRRIWDRMQDEMYYLTSASGHTYSVYQPWLRGFRYGGALGVSSLYYDVGDVLAEVWLDK